MSGQKESEEKKSGFNANQLVTVSDLKRFKADLLAELRKLVRPPSDQSIKKWLKSLEVRKLLEISAGKLQSMRKSGTIKYIKIGGCLYYDREDIQSMFEKNKVSG